MNQGLVRLEHFGDPGGIDQSKNPAPNTVRDARNLDSSGSCWTLRPGWQYVDSASSYLDADSPLIALVEKIPDNRYPTRIGYHLILVGKHQAGDYIVLVGVAPSGSHLVYQLDTPDTDQFTGLPMRTAHTLIKHTDGDTTRYVPAVIFTDGNIRPFYFVDDPILTSGRYTLDAQDGGDTDITYLPEVPRGKVIATFKSRLFMFNVPDAGNRVHFTAPDSSGVFTANVWPSGYNFDLGDQDEITAAIEFKGNLVIFKRHQIWILGGDGVGGNWQVQQVDDQYGALSQELVVNAGDSLVFMGSDGIYRWAGGEAVRVSHPKIQNLWQELNLTESGGRLNHATYDPRKRRVIFYVSLESGTEGDGYIVYNLERNTWDAWELFPQDMRDRFGVTHDTPTRIAAVRGWNKNRIEVFGVNGDDLYLMRENQVFDNWLDTAAAAQAILWYLRTPDYFLGDSDTKLLRNLVLDIADSGDWDLTVIPLLKNENPREALYRDATANTLVDSNASSTSHQTMGNCSFSDGDSIDVFYAPIFYKVKSTSIASVSGENITTNDAFTSVRDVTYIIEADKVKRTLRNMAGSCSLFGTAKYGNAPFTDLEVKRVTLGANLIGRQFALFLSNMNESNPWVSGAGKKGSPLLLGGWGLWVKPRRALRG